MQLRAAVPHRTRHGTLRRGSGGSRHGGLRPAPTEDPRIHRAEQDLFTTGRRRRYQKSPRRTQTWRSSQLPVVRITQKRKPHARKPSMGLPQNYCRPQRLVGVVGVDEIVDVLVQFVMRLSVDVDHVARLVVREADVRANGRIEVHVADGVLDAVERSG